MVDDNLRPLKSGSTCLYVPVCFHDAVSSKPASVGRDAADLHTQTTCVVDDCVVSDCGSLCCKCISQGSIRPSIDGLYRDGTVHISRELHKQCFITRRETTRGAHRHRSRTFL